MRLGLREMTALSKLLFSSVKDSTFFESCGVADLITTCCKKADKLKQLLFAYYDLINSYNHIICDSGWKKQESCRGFCKKRGEEVGFALSGTCFLSEKGKIID